MEHVNVQKMCTSTEESETLSVSQMGLPGSPGTSCAIISVMMTRNALTVIQEDQQLTSNKEKENISEIQRHLKLDKLEGKAKPNRKLTFLYLANDVIQNSKRKGPEFTKDFAPVIVEAFKHVSSESDESCKKHLGRVLSIWEERSVYENDVLEQLRQALYGDRKVRKRTYEQIKVDENNCSPRSSPTDPPQTTDLIRALQELENAASGDAAVHQRIASLPIEVQDVSLLDRITDKESGEQLSKMVDDACMLLADYNGRLAAEIDDRKQLTRMLSDFLRCQKEFLAEKEHKLEVVDMDLSSNDVTIH
ncbi:PREDICTED: regulation of nuclear pre-mRNA domain-containing protein 1A [Pygoscelis adeliae]|uniref:regulation of nuclear pre-mRNA domain-containing protein 1A n=1 Tax=Pygoscelis adeliae TaxID=9238 RepID=UPI0004F4DDF1|nr:PREDICTED: regulation of nuclear pre-mRNA domain-containing protein 1A [Pygoscelis adeliae]